MHDFILWCVPFVLLLGVVPVLGPAKGGGNPRWWAVTVLWLLSLFVCVGALVTTGSARDVIPRPGVRPEGVKRSDRIVVLTRPIDALPSAASWEWAPLRRSVVMAGQPDPSPLVRPYVLAAERERDTMRALTEDAFQAERRAVESQLDGTWPERRVALLADMRRAEAFRQQYAARLDAVAEERRAQRARRTVLLMAAAGYDFPEPLRGTAQRAEVMDGS